ncbi:MAG: hypothetical protein P8H17_06245 [Flavobacteriales bacterium]|nr:hypothetical protein [Flavobacteriales bacterium]
MKTKTQTKTQTKTRILKLFAIFTLLVSSNHLIAQTLPSSTPTQTVCANSTEPYEIPSTAQNASSAFQWTLSGGGTIQTGQGTNYITIDWGVSGGPYTLEVIESNGGCTSTLVTLDITIVDAPTATAGSNGDLCVGDIYLLSGTATNQVSVLWTTTGDGTFTNASSLNPNYDPGPNDELSGTVDLTLTSTGLATSGSACATSSSMLTLTIHQVPTATAGSNDNVCAGSNYILSGTSANGTGIWTTLGDGTFTNASSATSDYIPGPLDIIAGTVDLIWTVTGTAPSSLSCVSATSSMTLTIIPAPTAYAGPNDVICENNPYLLSAATATNQVSVQWATTGDGTFSNVSATSLNPDYTPGPNDILAGTVDLTITVTGNSPCLSIISTMTLTIIPNPIPGPIYHN